MAATIEEAIQEAGSRVLGVLGSKAHKLTWDEVQELTNAEPVEGEHLAYDGPYADEEDHRNLWTAYQDQDVIPAALAAVKARREEAEGEKGG